MTAISRTQAERAAPRTISVEAVAWAIILLAALLLRLPALGLAPLSADEVRQALAALQIPASGMPRPFSADSVLIVNGAAAAFVLFGATTASARLLTAVSGLLLVGAPALLRRRLGALPTLLASAWLALSPVAVASSRRMSGTGLAIGAFIVLLAAVDAHLSAHRRPSAVIAGSTLAIMLLADNASLLILAAAALGLGVTLITDEENALQGTAVSAATKGADWIGFLTGFAVTFTLLATLFFFVPGGFAAAADQAYGFWSGFLTRPTGALSPLLALGVSDLPLLVFGLIGAWLASQSEKPWDRFVAGWGIAALFLLLLHAGARPEQALWAAVPLALLAGRAITAMLEITHTAPRWGITATAAALIALTAMIAVVAARYLGQPNILPIPSGTLGMASEVNIPLDLVLGGLWIILLIIVWMTVASIWDGQAAWLGAGIAALAIGGALALGQSVTLAFVQPTSPYQPYTTVPGQPGLTRLVETTQEVGNLSIGEGQDIDITLQPDTGGLLTWALRDFTNVRTVTLADPTVQTALVIAPAGESDPALGDSYVGQDFVIAQSWTPGGLTLTDMVRWLLYRTAPAPTGETRIILWVREDIYRLVEAGGSLE
jgi:hypothetical protein